MLTEFRILRQDLAKTKAKKMCQANAKKRPRRLKVPFGPSLCEVPTAISTDRNIRNIKIYRIHSVKRYAPYLVSACDSTTLGYIRNIKIGGDVD